MLFVKLNSSVPIGLRDIASYIIFMRVSTLIWFQIMKSPPKKIYEFRHYVKFASIPLYFCQNFFRCGNISFCIYEQVLDFLIIASMKKTKSSSNSILYGSSAYINNGYNFSSIIWTNFEPPKYSCSVMNLITFMHLPIFSFAALAFLLFLILCYGVYCRFALFFSAFLDRSNVLPFYVASS